MSALFGMQINQVMLVLGIGLFVFVMFNRIRRGGASAGRSPRLGGAWRDERDSLAQSQRTRESIGARIRTASLPDHESWEVELHRLAREIKGEIDTKMRALEQLIELADEARVRLDSSLARAESLELNGEQETTTVFPERTTPNDGRSGQVGTNARRAKREQPRREPVLGARESVGGEPGDDPRFERVYALADAGFSATKIASQVGSQISEVELILSLRGPSKV
jgi:hypothetical protein